MSLHGTVKDKLKASLIQQNAVELSVFRMLSASMTNELLSLGRSPSDDLSDEETVALVRRAIKQRRDAITQFKKGKREDLVESEMREVEVLKTLLPKPPGREEIEKAVKAKIDELGGKSEAKAGPLIGAVAKELKGQASGAEIKAVVDSILGE
ncbi:MAG: GatB/YqeY domain-containing protein [Candidatus Taylorbacteria bacterium]|nr:GatB/YqeY domain-containing protein [Candidatus Taylorbacteria bacterium]